MLNFSRVVTISIACLPVMGARAIACDEAVIIKMEDKKALNIKPADIFEFNSRKLRDIGGYFGISVWNASAISLGTDLA